MNIKWFKRQMSLAGYTQRSIAKKIGINHTLISHMFRGRRRMPPDEYKAWASLLNVPVMTVIENSLGYSPASAFDDFSSASYDLDTDRYHVDQTDLADSLITIGNLYKEGIGKDLHIDAIKLIHEWRIGAHQPKTQ